MKNFYCLSTNAGGNNTLAQFGPTSAIIGLAGLFHQEVRSKISTGNDKIGIIYTLYNNNNYIN